MINAPQAAAPAPEGLHIFGEVITAARRMHIVIGKKKLYTIGIKERMVTYAI